MVGAELEVVDVDMTWTCSVPEMAGWVRGVALAAVTPVTAMVPAAAATAAASSLLWCLGMTDSFRLGFRSPGRFPGGEGQMAGDEPRWGRAGACRVVTGAGDRVPRV